MSNQKFSIKYTRTETIQKLVRTTRGANGEALDWFESKIVEIEDGVSGFNSEAEVYEWASDNNFNRIGMKVVKE